MLHTTEAKLHDTDNVEMNSQTGAEDEKEANKEINFYKTLNSLSVDIGGFVRDHGFNNIHILKNKTDYFVCGRLFPVSSNQNEKIERFKLAINLKHHYLIHLHGFDISNDGKFVLEIRKIDFVPKPLTRQILQLITRRQLLKLVSQIVEFINYISMKGYSASLMTLDDIFSCCFIDEDINIFFGNLSFIDVDCNINKSLMSVGMIISQLFGFELSINQDDTVKIPRFNEEIPLFWQQFISICIDQRININSFYPPLIKSLKENNNLEEQECDELETYEAEIEDKMVQDPKINEEKQIFHSMKELMSKYQHLIYHHIDAVKDKRFEELSAEIKEDGKTIFIQRISESLLDVMISKFLIHVNLVHPMLLPLKGIEFTNSYKTINIYRETDQIFTPIEWKKLSEESDERRLKWLKQIFDFVSFINQNTNYVMKYPYMEKFCALDTSDNIVLVNLLPFEQSSSSDDKRKINSKSFWSMTSFLTDKPYKINVSRTFIKLYSDRDYTDFCSLKEFLNAYESNVNIIENKVMKYLEDYYVEKEIDGHQCHVAVYRRNFMSNKRFKRLVLKKYGFSFSESLRDLQIQINKREKCIIETWTNESESFILMKYIDAQRLRDLVPDLSYEQKILVLKRILEKIEKHFMFVLFCNLSVSNIYLDRNFEVKLVDLIFVSDDVDDPFLAPEVSHFSSMKTYEKYKVDIYSVGIIAYEMFGKKFNPDRDFDFENIPTFIKYFVQVCCNKKAIERLSVKTLFERLEKYQDQDVEKLFSNDFIEVSPYYIDPNDLYTTTIGRSYGHFTQRSTKKYLIVQDPGSLIYDNVTEKMRKYIMLSKCRNCIPIYGFSNTDDFKYFYEFKNNFITITYRILENYDFETKYEIFKKQVQTFTDIVNLGFITGVGLMDVIIDRNKEIKFAPTILNEERYEGCTPKQMKKSIKGFVYDMAETLRGRKTENYEIDDLPLNIQALVWKIYVDIKENLITYSQISDVFEGWDDKQSAEIEIDWNEEHGSLGNDEYTIYRSNKNPDLVEEGIRVEILTKSSNIRSYSRKDNNFALIYHEKLDPNVFERLYNLENLTLKAYKEMKKLNGFNLEREYKGKHCTVKYLIKGEECYVLKKYYQKYDNLSLYGDIIEYDGEQVLLQKFIDAERLGEFIERRADFIDDAYIREFAYQLIKYYSFYRYSPHNIYINKNDRDVIIVDSIDLNSENYEDFKDEFVAPECQKVDELNSEDKKYAVIYSVGWTVLFMLGLAPEMDSNTNRFILPKFPDEFPQFWKDYITLSTRENSIDRPKRKYLRNKLRCDSMFDEIDYVLVSPKFINHDDFEIIDPIGAGGESIIYLAKNKITGEKHACKRIKYNIRSIEIKRILLSIDKLDDSIYGIKYIGVSVKEKEVFLHMEYVPNGSLSDVITLDRRMSPPSWFTETAKLRLSKEIAVGMQSLHEHGIVHGDLKPENILLDSNNSVKICDFTFISEEGAATPLFMAPELFNGEDATYKSDVYSYAITLCCLFGGGDLIGSLKTATSGNFRPSISVSTPSSIQSIIRKCWQHNPDDRPTFSEIVDQLNRTDTNDFDMRIDSMDEFQKFDMNKKRGELTENYEYEICDITGDADDVEHLIRLHTTIQPENILQIHKYCRLNDKIVLIIEKVEKQTFDVYINEKKKVSQARGEKFISDFISLFELYHKNRFFFGPFSLKRVFFRDNHRSLICFDLFEIPGLVRPNKDVEAMVSPPEGFYSRESDIYAFSCFVLKIFGCLAYDPDGNISKKPFKRTSKLSVQPIPLKYQNIIMERCLNKEPMTRPTFELLFQKLFPAQYKIISTFLSVSVSRFSTFNMNDMSHEEIIQLETLGSGTFGNVIHAFNKTSNQHIAIKEFNDKTGEKNTDFMLEYVALKAIDHPNIVKILGASQRKESVHGSQLFMEYAGGGDLDKNMNEPFEWFIIHLFQISSAMKYLHQRGIIHFDLKPKNILIREDGSAVVADFNTALHVDIDTHLRNQRGSWDYMSPEVKKGEKYSFSTDVYSFGLMACEHFSHDAHRLIHEANEKYERSVLDFIPDKSLRSLLEFCVDDDPMSRPSFDFICSYLFKKFIKGTSNETELEALTQIPRIDEDKLNQLHVLALRGSAEAIVEYVKYLLHENSFEDAMHVLLKGANEGDAYCQNTLGVLSMTYITNKIIDEPRFYIANAADQDDKFSVTNCGYLLYKNYSIGDAIEALEQAYSMGVTYAGYILGLVYEKEEVEGMSFEERIRKAIDLYHDAAIEGDAFAQYKYGLCLEDGLTVDADGFDCVHYFRLSAYQRCRKGVNKYVKYLEGDRKEYYLSLKSLLPKGDFHYIWADEQDFFEEMMAAQTGMLLFDSSSNEKFNFLSSRIFDQLYIRIF